MITAKSFRLARGARAKHKTRKKDNRRVKFASFLQRSTVLLLLFVSEERSLEVMNWNGQSEPTTNHQAASASSFRLKPNNFKSKRAAIHLITSHCYRRPINICPPDVVGRLFGSCKNFEISSEQSARPTISQQWCRGRANGFARC